MGRDHHQAAVETSIHQKSALSENWKKQRQGPAYAQVERLIRQQYEQEIGNPTGGEADCNSHCTGYDRGTEPRRGAGKRRKNYERRRGSERSAQYRSKPRGRCLGSRDCDDGGGESPCDADTDESVWTREEGDGADQDDVLSQLRGKKPAAPA